MGRVDDSWMMDSKKNFKKKENITFDIGMSLVIVESFLVFTFIWIKADFRL